MATNLGVAPLAGLREIVGEEHARAAMAGDAVDGVRPRFVVAPGSVEEVAAVMRLAHSAGLTVAPRGAGTKLGWGNRPCELDLIVSTRRLDGPPEHAVGDLVVRAGAGVTLETLQGTVGQAGQRLALDPPEKGATLGGIVAANPSGPLRLRYGTARDLLIGATVVLADGMVAKAGGKVVKNVAGYDLCKLFAGSLGTLGIVVETIWRLHPVPAARRTVVVEVATSDELGLAAQDLLHGSSPLVLDALDVRWDPQPFSRAREREAGGAGSLAVLFEGIEPGVVAQAETAERLLARFGASRITTTEEQDALWRAARAYPWHGQGEGYDVGLKITHPLAALPDILGSIVELARAHGMVARITGHAATGVTFVALSGRNVGSVPTLLEELRERVARAEGSVVALCAPPDIKERIDVWGPVGDALPLMRRVKERFDPDGILNPGRFVGDI